MKNTYIIIIASLFIASCAKEKQLSTQDVIASKDLKKIIALKSSLNLQKQELDKEIKLLSEEIAKLDTNKKVSLVTMMEVKEKPFSHYIELQGNVKTDKNIVIYPEAPGQIERILVKEGQRVHKGQVLAKLDAGGLPNQLAQAKAAEQLAKTTFERQKRLWNQKIGSEIQYLQTKTNYEAQRNAVANLTKVLAKYTIKAPFSGSIDDVIKEVGAMAAPGMGGEVFRIVNLKDMYVEAEVPESYINVIKKGKSVDVALPMLGKTIASKVKQVGSFINPINRTFKITVAVPNKNKMIKPNLTAKLKLNDYEKSKTILIPQNIISENSKKQVYLYLVDQLKGDEGIAKQIFVKLGKSQDGMVEVLSGLNVGDKIVDEGARSVINGVALKIRK